MGNMTDDSNLVQAISSPSWLRDVESEWLGRCIPGDEAQVRFVIRLAVKNVTHGTGGPFGAAIFRCGSGELVAVGVNCVVPAAQSWAHAEMTAFAHAQNRLGSHSLDDCVLVTSCEPCAMCYGATPWSGVKELVYGAPGDFARSIGFDEGDKPEDWQAALESRGISVRGPMLTGEAVEPFALYRDRGRIY